MTSTLRDALHTALIRDEGLRLKPYKDTTGHLTIGVGHNLDAKGITLAQAMEWLDEDMDQAESEMLKWIPWAASLSEPRQGVLINMIFNMGIYNVLEFKRTLAHVQAGRFAEAAKGMLDSKWAEQVGNRAIRLAKVMEFNHD